VTGQDIIDLIQSNGLEHDEMVVMDDNGKMVYILNVESAIQRDPYDGDFDKTVGAIKLHRDVTLKDD
jgi:hypothetical protein